MPVIGTLMVSAPGLQPGMYRECAVVFAGSYTVGVVVELTSVGSAEPCSTDDDTRRYLACKVVGVSEATGLQPTSNAKMRSSGQRREQVEQQAPLPVEKPAVLLRAGFPSHSFVITADDRATNI